MRKIALLRLTALLLLMGSHLVQAQKKLFTYEQLFKGGMTNISKPLPNIAKWVDDDHYLDMHKEADGSVKPYLVGISTRSAVPYTGEIPVPKTTERIVEPADSKNATASPDGKYIAFTRKNNLYIMDRVSKKETALTTDGSDVILNGYASWIYYEEILGRASRYKAFWWSGDSKTIAYMRFDETQVPVFPIYVADGQHGYLENQRYPKPGDKNPEVKIGLVSVENNTTVWADFNAKDDQYFGTPVWTPENKFWVQWMNRKQNVLKIYDINIANGSKKELYNEEQKTWISLDDDRLTFINGGKQFIISSDKTGWSHLYLYNADGTFVNAITQGDFSVTDIVQVDEKKKEIFVKARKENSARFDLYKVDFTGKNFKRLTFGNFTHDDFNFSPNNRYFFTTYSNISTPTQMALVDANGKFIRGMGDIKGTAFETYNLPKTELVRVKSSDGLFEFPVTITYPINFDSNKKYPVLVSIYGGPNAGTVYDRWKPVGGSAQWWAQEGLVQVAFDNRSSGHFGKMGMNYIYRQLGKYEIEDFMDCGRWLKQQPWMDTAKLCITGGSFGGYMTCMALTYGANVFNYGIAVSSVTDWQLYDTHYTERFMGTPADNAEGYKNTAAITYIGKYKGLLRIVHGTTDDNVHMQNSMQLINKLQDQKKHFELMLYPNERHGIGANSAAKRTHNMLEAYTFYYKYLLEKPMPEQFWK